LYVCGCYESNITYNECICDEYRKKIDLLNDELVHLDFFTRLDEIKKYPECAGKRYRIEQVSIELRQLNRMLLENLVKIK
jgi:hypothetical protein